MKVLFIPVLFAILFFSCKKKNHLKYIPGEYWMVNDSTRNATGIEIVNGSAFNNYDTYSLDASDISNNAINIVLYYNNNDVISGNYFILSPDSIFNYTDSSKYCTVSVAENKGLLNCWPIGKIGDSVNVADANGELKIIMSNISMTDSANKLYSVSANFFEPGQ